MGLSFQISDFIFFENIPRSGIARSYGGSIFSFLGKLISDFIDLDPLFLLMSLSKSLFYLFKKPSLGFGDLFKIYFLSLYFIYSCSDLYDFFPFTKFGFCFLSLPSSFNCKERLFEMSLVS